MTIDKPVSTNVPVFQLPTQATCKFCNSKMRWFSARLNDKGVVDCYWMCDGCHAVESNQAAPR